VFNFVSSSLTTWPLAVFLSAVVFALIAASLVWYALQQNNDELRAKFGHGKTIFELEIKKRRERHKSNSRPAGSL
jgi:hypothetical protein